MCPISMITVIHVQNTSFSNCFIKVGTIHTFWHCSSCIPEQNFTIHVQTTVWELMNFAAWKLPDDVTNSGDEVGDVRTKSDLSNIFLFLLSGSVMHLVILSKYTKIVCFYVANNINACLISHDNNTNTILYCCR